VDIQDLRKEIDCIDDQLVQLFVQRMHIAEQVAIFKKENGLPIFVPAREQEKLADVAEKAGPAMAEYAQKLYTTIFELSRAHQSKRNQEGL
jgi:monofunctional chorismate mutase